MLAWLAENGFLGTYSPEKSRPFRRIFFFQGIDEDGSSLHAGKSFSAARASPCSMAHRRRVTSLGRSRIAARAMTSEHENGRRDGDIASRGGEANRRWLGGRSLLSCLGVAQWPSRPVA
jgi:hypothetical protein